MRMCGGNKIFLSWRDMSKNASASRAQDTFAGTACCRLHGTRPRHWLLTWQRLHHASNVCMHQTFACIAHLTGDVGCHDVAKTNERCVFSFWERTEYRCWRQTCAETENRSSTGRGQSLVGADLGQNKQHACTRLWKTVGHHHQTRTVNLHRSPPSLQRSRTCKTLSPCSGCDPTRNHALPSLLTLIGQHYTNIIHAVTTLVGNSEHQRPTFQSENIVMGTPPSKHGVLPTFP